MRLDQLLPAAAAARVQIVVQIRPEHARAFATKTGPRIRLFGRFVRKLAASYPQIRDYVVGNEPNQPRFMQPQFDRSGKLVSAGVHERVLAAGYDALKAVDRRINVIGVAVSARGNDDPRAKDNVSSSPVRFIEALGKAYRSSGRKRPLMDQLELHPYPNLNTDPPARGWDAFHGTAQPTFAEPGRKGRSLTLVIGEIAWQVGVLPSLAQSYFGTESVPVVDEGTQARYYAQAIGLLRCDPAVRMLLFFQLVDSADLERFQSGLLRVDGSPRPALTAVRDALAAPTSCPKRPAWRHETGVIGARARVASGARRVVVEATALEGGTVRVVVARAGEAKRLRSLLDRPSATTELRPERLARVVLPRPAAAGRYVVGVLLQAEANPARSAFFTRPLRGS
jgi:hypothetical protein